MLLLGSAGWWVDPASADVTKAPEAVQQALRSEVAGLNEDRDRLLREALERLPNCQHAMWHTGYVREGSQWVKYDEVAKRSVQDADLAEYRKLRDESSATIEGQVALARWCDARGLKKQMRAHATAALELDLDNAVARRLLGHRYVNGSWVSPNDIEQAEEQWKRNAADLQKWRPHLQRLIPRLAQADKWGYDRAVETVLAIDDPAAIPAMEAILAPTSENAALCVTHALSRMTTSHKAAGALARLAVFSPDLDVRDAAVAALQKRSLDHFVPVLLSGMSSPIIAKAELYASPRGRLIYRQTFEREGQYFSEKAVLDTEYGGRLGTRYGQAWLSGDLASRQGNTVQAVAAQNAHIALVNQRIRETLARTTGHEVENTMDSWWDWWNSHNEVYLVGNKPEVKKYARQEVNVPPPPPPPSLPAPAPSMKDCLVAGTPVWTDRGLVPIQEVRVGDCVLSQAPDTGRIAYQPVLRTTVRPEGQVIRIVYEDGFLQCSGGHPLWIDGEGWVKARSIQEGSFFHTIRGAVPVLSVSPAGTEETYNLIVADSHSYFVTEALILSHDNTIRELTDAVVPGLKRSEEAPSK
jgi:hypothetical protein